MGPKTDPALILLYCTTDVSSPIYFTNLPDSTMGKILWENDSCKFPQGPDPNKTTEPGTALGENLN